MESILEGLIKRAATNGTKSAIGIHKHDYSNSKFFKDDTDRMCRSYPMYAKEIREAYDTAYKAEASSYVYPRY